MNVDIFVQNVKALCKAQGTTPSAASEASGAGRNFMDNIKRGSIPSVAKVQMLAEYLGVTTSELLGEAPGSSSAGQGSNANSELTQMYDRLTADAKKEVLAFLRFKLQQQE